MYSRHATLPFAVSSPCTLRSFRLHGRNDRQAEDSQAEDSHRLELFTRQFLPAGPLAVATYRHCCLSGVFSSLSCISSLLLCLGLSCSRFSLWYVCLCVFKRCCSMRCQRLLSAGRVASGGLGTRWQLRAGWFPVSGLTGPR